MGVVRVNVLQMAEQLRNKKPETSFMSQRNSSIIFLAMILSYACHVRADRIRHARYLGQAIDAIQQKALKTTTRQELFEGAMRGMVDVLDKKGDHHSVFINARETESFMAELDQQIVGVGVRLTLKAPEGEKEKQLTVTEGPLVGSPAFKAEIHKGDRILAVDGKRISGLDMSQIVALIRGEEGEAGLLTIKRDSKAKPFDIYVVRGTIKLPSVLGDLCDKRGDWDFLLPPDNRVAYVRITSFGAKTTAEMQAVLKSLAEKNARGLILDVRDNPGGELNAVVEVCRMFLAEGNKIVSTHGRGNVQLEQFEAEEKGSHGEIPIAVLINRHSASASEILAACLQDNGRAVVIGERSYGKGTVQQLLMMEGGRSRLKLTAHEYHRPSEKNIHRAKEDTPKSEIWGVIPDKGFVIQQTEEEETAWRKARRDRDEAGLVEQNNGKELPEFVDLVRQRAVEYLLQKIN